MLGGGDGLGSGGTANTAAAAVLTGGLSSVAGTIGSKPPTTIDPTQRTDGQTTPAGTPPPASAPGAVVAGGAPTLPPEQPPQNAQQQAAVDLENKALDQFKAGDQQSATKSIQLAQQYVPQNQRIKEIASIIIPHVMSGLNQQTLAQKAAGLLEQRQTDGVPDAGQAPQALLASPISWGQAKAPPTGNFTNPIQEFLKRDPAQEAVLKMRLRDYAGAEDALTRHLDADPTDWLSWRTRALARQGLKKYQGSFDDATRALALNPKDGMSRAIRASDLTRMNRPQEAVAEAETALKINPDDGGAYAARAQALQRLGRDDEALTDLLRASELDPQFKQLYADALARREGGGASGRARLAYGSGALAALLLLAGLALGRRGTEARTTTSRRAPLRSADRSEVPQGFEIVRTLGEGGMGVVYEAVDKSLERPVALKKMRAEIAADPRERRRLVKEARTVANLHHPNIVQIYSIVEDGQDLFLVFELLKGATLHELIGGKPLAREKALAVVDQVAAALYHAHAKGVIHRDLKPSNVLVSGDQAKVMDFGIARSAQQTMSTATRHEIVGTPLYMAPEQEQGLPSGASDVYSLGVCAYEMLTGRLPFPGGGLMQKLNADYPKLSESGFPAGLDATLARALDPEPGKRFASAGELARELRRGLAS